jgi:hypothetical protein
MGTSRTNKGPGDRPPLLPPWALPGGPPPPLPPEPLEESDEADEPGDADANDSTSPAPPSPDPGQPAPWRAARRAMNSWARNGGGAGIARAGQSFARAAGGSRAAASQATHGRATAARVGGFFGTLAERGLAAALESIGIAGYVDHPAEEVFAAIANALAPPGATLEEAAAKRASDEVLGRLYAEYVEADGDLTRLERMTLQDAGEAVHEVISAYIYNRWLIELGKSIEAGATSPAQAVRLEREVRQYVRDIVQLDINPERLQTLALDRPEGQAVVQRLFEEAYGLLEG